MSRREGRDDAIGGGDFEVEESDLISTFVAGVVTDWNKFEKLDKGGSSMNDDMSKTNEIEDRVIEPISTVMILKFRDYDESINLDVIKFPLLMSVQWRI